MMHLQSSFVVLLFSNFFILFAYDQIKALISLVSLQSFSHAWTVFQTKFFIDFCQTSKDFKSKSGTNYL